jgi:uncharacterized delta-60 repeat protein
MLLRNWLEILKTSCGLNSLRQARRQSPLRKRHAQPFFQAAEVCEERRLLSAGALDPTFGSGGTASPTASIKGSAAAIAVYSNAQSATAGDVVTAGNVILSNGDRNFAVVRYTANGTPDSSFGKNGEVTTSFGGSYGYNVATGVAIQTDGKIVAGGSAVGSSVKGNSYDFALVRYNVNGTLDNTFGSGGVVTTNFSGSGGYRTASADQASAEFIQPNGKIVLAGITCGATGLMGRDNNIALARYNANGTLDTTFGIGGKVTTSHALIPGSLVSSGTDGITQVNDAALQADGKILVSGYTQVTGGASPNYEVFVARYNTNGTLDSSFGTGGFVILPPANGNPSGSEGHVAVEPSGEIVFTGFGQSALLHSGQAGYTDGSLDASFGNNGIVSRGYGAVALEPNGDIVGRGGNEITRFLPSGAVDATFGSAGTVTLSTGSLGGLAIQPDGKIDVAINNQIPDGIIYGTEIGFMVDRLLPGEPEIGSLTTNASTVTAGTNVTAIASNITDANPNASIAQVAFTVEDSNGNIVAQGYATQTTAGTWSFSFSTKGWPAGTYTIIAQAEDSYGVLGDLQTTTETLI